MAFFCTYMHIHTSELEANLVERIRIANDEELYQIWHELRATRNRVAQLSFHETYHYFQGLNLPYLFLNSINYAHAIFTIFKKLCINNSDFHRWDASIVGLDSLSVSHTIEGTIGTLQLISIPGNNSSSVSLNLIDLLEAATTLAQFQVSVTINEKTEPRAFKKWTINNPSYLKVYKFLSIIFNDDKLTLRLLIPLINASFHTSQPIRAFTDLLNGLHSLKLNESSLYNTFLAQKEPCKWDELFKYISSKYITFETEINNITNNDNRAYCMLTIANWVGSSYGQFNSSPVNHPFINYHAYDWIKRAEENASYTAFISLPGYMPTSFIKEIAKDFFPSIIFLKIHIDGINDRFLTIGSIETTHSYTFPIPFLDLMTIFSAVKRAANIQYINEHRFCTHSKCPEFQQNYCNSYPAIPEDFRTCGFPARLNHLIRSLT